MKDNRKRHISMMAIGQIDYITRWKERHRGLSEDYREVRKAYFPHEPSGSSRCQGFNEAIKQRLGIQMDDSKFKILMTESQVLAGRDFTCWNWDSIMELLQGPMMNPKRMEETLKTTKFFKRLLSFLRPSKKNFVEIRNSKVK
jgi:rapamycin-insensitive companion of mTOR